MLSVLHLERKKFRFLSDAKLTKCFETSVLFVHFFVLHDYFFAYKNFPRHTFMVTQIHVDVSGNTSACFG